jgi:AhpD family alkylhydroperoxidase
MTLRLNYVAAAPEVFKALNAVSAALKKSSVPGKLLDLVYLRVSQINGCSYCVDLHSRDLRAAGEGNDRLDGLAAWRESPFFDEAEKALLDWAESLTHIAETHAPDDVYESVRQHYAEADLAHLTYAIAVMNAWNRMAIGFRVSPKPR